MFAREHPEAIEGRRRLIDTYVLDSEEAAEDGSIDNGDDALDNEYDRGLVEAGMRIGVTQSGT